MTTEKSADTTTNCSGLDDSQPPVKRYDLGPRYEQGFSAPDIIEKAYGRFVLYDEVLPLLKIIQLQEALLAKQTADMEAIGAGGVSAKRITRPDVAELISDAAEIIDTLTSELDTNHPIRASAQNRAKRAVWELYVLAESISKTEGEKS